MAWKPLTTNGVIGSNSNYEYSPSAIQTPIGTLLFACVGDQLDKIGVYNLKTKKSALISRPGTLICDPAVAMYGDKILLVFTQGRLGGQHDGRFNGIVGTWLNYRTMATSSDFVLVPHHTDPAVYGYGQPGISAKPYSTTLLTFTDTSNGENRFRAVELHVDTLPKTGNEWYIANNDGANVTGYWVDSVTLAVVVTGGGYVGLRSYVKQVIVKEGRPFISLIRQTNQETLRTGSFGSFSAISSIAVVNAIDGAGVTITSGNQPVIVNRQLDIWVGIQTGTTLGTWDLGNFRLPVPAQLLPR